MIVLIILSVVFLITGVVLLGSATRKVDDSQSTKLIAAIALMFLWGILYGAGFSMISDKYAQEIAYKNSIEGNNPYEKEYVYKKIDSTFVVVDSIYIKNKPK